MRSASVDESTLLTPWTAASPKRISRDEDEDEDDDDEDLRSDSAMDAWKDVGDAWSR